MARAQPCELPAASHLLASLPRIDHGDSFGVAARAGGRPMVELYAAVLDHLPAAFKTLLVLRSKLVSPFGIAGVSYSDLREPIDTARSYAIGDKIGRWTLFQAHDDELITGADDKHLDFRVSLLRDGADRVVLSTAVMTKNAFGRAYLRTILPFHRFGVAKLLSDAARAGRL